MYGGYGSSNESSVLFNHPWMTLSVIMSSAGLSLLAGVKPALIPLFIFGALALSEYYMSTACGLLRGKYALAVVLVALGVAPIALVFDSFCEVTLRFLSFQFNGVVDVTLNSFCTFCVILSIASVVLPSMLAGNKSGGANAVYLPGNSGETMFWSSSVHSIFGVGAIVFSAFSALLELIVREQVPQEYAFSMHFIYQCF